MRLITATWPEVEAYLEKSKGIIVPIGSTEQHGPNGMLGTDAIRPRDHRLWRRRVYRSTGCTNLVNWSGASSPRFSGNDRVTAQHPARSNSRCRALTLSPWLPSHLFPQWSWRQCFHYQYCVSGNLRSVHLR